MLAEIQHAILEPAGDRDRRGPERRSLRLETKGSVPAKGATRVLIRDISETGLLLECSSPLSIGETITLDLPSVSEVEACVVWSSGNLHGCEFTEALTRGSVSAALLRSPFVGEDAGASAEPDDRYSRRTRYGILIGGALISWAIVGAAAAALI